MRNVQMSSFTAIDSEPTVSYKVGRPDTIWVDWSGFSANAQMEYLGSLWRHF